MEALGALNPLDAAEGMIQEKVAHFLALKASINTLRNHPSLQIRQEAEASFVMQKKLEGDLQVALEKIAELKKGPWLFSNVVEITGFAYKMTQQINKVNKLREQAARSPLQPSPSMIPGFDQVPDALKYGVVALGGVVILKLMKVF